MAIITISRGCHSHGKEIAECVAADLGYECISQEILLEASRFFNMPEEKLFESLHDAPGFLERLTHVRQRFVDGFRAALLDHVVKDNVVYHGFAGQILLAGVSHVLRVRVLADMEERVRMLTTRENVTRKEAERRIANEDHERSEWYRNLYGIDMNDPHLYDLMAHIGRLTIDDACDIIRRTASGESFKATAESTAALSDLAVESHVKVALEGVCKADVTVRDGVVRLRVKGQKLTTSGFAGEDARQQLQSQIQQDVYDRIVAAVSDVPGVKDIDCAIDSPYYV